MHNKNDSLYEIILSGEQIASYQIPDIGKTWVIESIDFNAPSSDSGWIALIWDYEGETEEIIDLTYSSKMKRIDHTVIGDGIKKLAIVLHNESNTELCMGGSYYAKEL